MNELKRQELKDKGISINEDTFPPTNSFVMDEFTTFSLKLSSGFIRYISFKTSLNVLPASASF